MVPRSLLWVGLLAVSAGSGGCAELVGADFDDPRERPIEGAGGGPVFTSFLKAIRPEVDARFGYMLAFDDRGLATVAPFEDEGSLANAGATYYFDFTRPSDPPVRIVVPNADAGDGVVPAELVSQWVPGDDLGGLRVALNDDVLVIGVPSEASANARDPANNDAPSSGAVFIYDRSRLAEAPDDIWPLQYLKSPRIQAGALFGEAISLSGTRLAVGAPAEDGAAPDSGAVYVYERVGGAFEPSAPALHPPALHEAEGFGASLEVDGDLLVVGAPGDSSDGSTRNSGAAHVFRWSSEQWKQEAYLKPQAAGAFGLFGLDVSVSGGRLAVGAPGLNSRCTQSAPNGTGAIEIYAAVAGSWVFEQCLAARSRQGLVQFGIALALREDRLVVGAPWDASGRRDDPGDVSRRYAGAAYVFDRSAHGSWQERAYVKAPEIDFDDGFGLSVAISGERLAIGAAQESGGFSGTNANLSDNSARFAGAVYVFSFEGE